MKSIVILVGIVYNKCKKNTFLMLNILMAVFFVFACFVCVCARVPVCFSSVHMEESSVMQGAQGVLVQNWPTASSAAGKNLPTGYHLD